MDYIIKRQESEDVKKERSWLMIYGRRKTGKTFLLRHLCTFNKYYLVKKDLSILSENKIKTAAELVKEVNDLLKQNKSVVIDEFQRLDESILEEIVQEHPKGRLILSGSSLRVTKKVFDSSSPLLGFFTPMKIGLIRPFDVLKELKDLKAEQKIEFSTFLREPWLIPIYNKENILEFVYKIVTKSKHIISSLIGEIFSEEERELSKRYTTILSLIGAGVWGAKELTNSLYNRNLIPDPSPTHIIQYLKNLEEMELVESIKLYKSKNKYFYRLMSPIMNIYYYLDDRYNITNREVSLEEIKPTLRKLINFEIQNFLADFSAEKFSGRKEYFLSPSKEIDFIITQRNKPLIVGEVKWKKISLADVENFKESSADFFCRKILMGKQGIKSEEIEVLDSQSIIKGMD